MQTTTSRLGHGGFLLLAYAITMSGAGAELPPSAYKERQQNAPEALVIKVRSITQRDTEESQWKQTDFTVEAEVKEVHRSATKLLQEQSFRSNTVSVILRSP